MGVLSGRALVLLVAAAACDRPPPLASCDDDLRGVYTAERAGDRERGDERWMVLDHGATLEAYPLFPDRGAAMSTGTPVHAGAEADPTEPGRLEIAPSVIDLARSGGLPGGTLRRRYQLRAAQCEARVPVHITRCAGASLELVLGDPSPPLSWSPCHWSLPGPTRVVRWHRDRA